MLIHNNGRTIEISVGHAGYDDVSSGLFKIPHGIIPEEVIVNQRQEDGSILKVRFIIDEAEKKQKSFNTAR